MSAEGKFREFMANATKAAVGSCARLQRDGRKQSEEQQENDQTKMHVKCIRSLRTSDPWREMTVSASKLAH